MNAKITGLILLALLLVLPILACASDSGPPGGGDDSNTNGEFASVSAGRVHTCAVRDGGSVECWAGAALARAGSTPSNPLAVQAPIIPSFVGMVDAFSPLQHP